MKDGKSAKQNQQQQQQQQHQKDHLSPFKLAKLLDPEASWDKDQLGDVLHWIRQVAALVCGLLWGAIPVVGGIWIILFLAISSGIVYGYYAMILKIDEEEYGGHGALLQEGLFASVTLFLVEYCGIASLYGKKLDGFGAHIGVQRRRNIKNEDSEKLLSRDYFLLFFERATFKSGGASNMLGFGS